MKSHYHGLNTAEDVRQSTYHINYYRKGKQLNLTLLPYAILGIDGEVLAVRKYPPIKPKDLRKFMVPCGPIKVKPGMFYRDGTFHETSED